MRRIIGLPGGIVMKEEKKNTDKRKPYEEPKVLATYGKEELKDIMMPHGPVPNPSGCGCGGGS
ncbi:MAG: hypothetical protein C4581_01940 [Nitrospiraceae bacterium]|nr:MAG: hypothetical protein C4581_01940 [Nitrospiraceae bacterium]